MTKSEVMLALKEMGNDQTKKILMSHGAKEPVFGVKVADLKKIIKKTKKKNQALAEELFATGNSDAMYLGGLIADEKTISKATLQKWVETAYWSYLSEYAVAWVSAESPYGWELGLEWIENKEENIAAAGWSTLSNIVAMNNDEDLDVKTLSNLLKRAEKEVHRDKNRVSYTMNNFIISVAAYVQPLTEEALIIAKNIGKVKVDMNGTACKVPVAYDYVKKMEKMGRLYKKKKVARC
ncbi:MAG: DNA alkylation repair protein [Chitinophagales bacterium]